MINVIENGTKEGVDYINISAYSETELGKMLAPGYPVDTQLIIGQIGTVRAAVSYVITPGYPHHLLGKKKFTRSDVRSIPTRTITVDNYWAIYAYILIERVRQDQVLRKLLLENTLDFTSYTIRKETLLGEKTSMLKINNSMRGYIDIIKQIKGLLVNEKLDDDTRVKDVILSYAAIDDISKLFDGSTVSIKA